MMPVCFRTIQRAPFSRFPLRECLGRNGSFTDPFCEDQLCGPLQPAFTSDGQMVVGMIGYVGSRFPLVYTNPLGSQTADTYLNDFSSYSYSAVFDSNDDLYVADLDRSRVLVYRHPLTIGGSPAVNFSPASLTFPGQLVGTQSNPRPVTLTNTGNRTLIITNIATSGDFSQTNTCGTSVAAGANCVVNVIFAPTKKGARTGALTITDNATGSPHSVSLTGTGAVNPVPVEHFAFAQQRQRGRPAVHAHGQWLKVPVVLGGAVERERLSDHICERSTTHRHGSGERRRQRRHCRHHCLESTARWRDLQHPDFYH